MTKLWPVLIPTTTIPTQGLIGLLQLGMGNWADGWRNFRHRLKFPFEDKRPAMLPDIIGKRVILFEEQGFGDIIQFIRYVTWLSQLVSELSVGVPHALVRLMQHLAMPKQKSPLPGFMGQQPTIRIIDTDLYKTPSRYPEHDYVIPMMDCPYLFGTTLESVPNSVPYFKFSAAQPHYRPRVGLCWDGGKAKDFATEVMDRKRSIPFAMIKPLIDEFDGFEFVSLQLPDQHVSHDGLAQALTATGDFLDTANVIKDLDCVITIDSAVAHLAGAMAKPVFLLNRFDGCWRWLWPEPHDPSYSRTPWYPTMRIFRQKAPNTWPAVIEDVATQLRTLGQ